MAKIEKNWTCPHCEEDFNIRGKGSHLAAKHSDNPRGGRPTTFKKEYIDKVDEYIEQCEDKREKQIKYETSKSTGFSYYTLVNIPTIEGFAEYIGVHVKTVEDWRKAQDEFSSAITRIKDVQKKRLVEGGLSKIYDSKMARFLLNTNHDMKEKKEHDHSFSLTDLLKKTDE